MQENQIFELDQFLILTMVQVAAHQNMLYGLDTKLLIMNKTLVKTLRALTHLKFTVAILTDIQTAIHWLTSGILGLKENMDSFYEYLCMLASHTVNPLIIPPHELRKILIKISEEMKHKPRLNLPNDPDNNIWAYHSIMKVIPVAQDNFLFIT